MAREGRTDANESQWTMPGENERSVSSSCYRGDSVSKALRSLKHAVRAASARHVKRGGRIVRVVRDFRPRQISGVASSVRSYAGPAKFGSSTEFVGCPCSHEGSPPPKGRVGGPGTSSAWLRLRVRAIPVPPPCRKRPVAAAQKQVEVIRHRTPRIQPGPGCYNKLAKALHETRSIPRVSKDVPAVNATRYHVVDEAGKVETGLARHSRHRSRSPPS